MSSELEGLLQGRLWRGCSRVSACEEFVLPHWPPSPRVGTNATPLHPKFRDLHTEEVRKRSPSAWIDYGWIDPWVVG